MKSEVWAAWWQAILSAFAIVSAAYLASHKEREEERRKLNSIVRFLRETAEKAEKIARGVPYQSDGLLPTTLYMTPDKASLGSIYQASRSLRAKATGDLPDLSLIPILIDAAEACEVFVSHLSEGANGGTLNSAERAVESMKTALQQAESLAKQ